MTQNHAGRLSGRARQAAGAACDTSCARGAPLRLRRPADVLAAVPYLLGFHPRASVVLLGLAGPRGRVRPVVRADLAADELGAAGQAVYLAGCLRRGGADRAVAVVYADGGPPEPVRAASLGALRSALGQRSIDVVDALVVTGDRWRSALCRDPDCCPPSGTLIRDPAEPGGSSLVAARAAYAGLAPLDSRAALADRLRPAGGALGEATVVALERTTAAPERPERPPGSADSVEGTQALFAALVRARSGGDAPIDIDDGARLIAGLGDVAARDACLHWADGRHVVLAPAAEVLAELARRAPPPYGAPPATLLAFLAWRRGDGALANLAVERALADDPGYRLARLLARTLAAGLDPGRWDGGVGLT